MAAKSGAHGVRDIVSMAMPGRHYSDALDKGSVHANSEQTAFASKGRQEAFNKHESGPRPPPYLHDVRNGKNDTANIKVSERPRQA